MDELKTFEDLKNHHKKVSRKSWLIILLTTVCLATTFFLALFVGNYHLTISEVLRAFVGDANDNTNYALFEVRVPRLLSVF